ncbi:DNA-binding transcriptional regulator, LysR-type [Escherichia coli]|nr:DNA-binding transcriptional regulator, LysR-type [Escherichia coli]
MNFINFYRDFLNLKEIKLEHPLPSIKLYISYNKSSLNNLVSPDLLTV